MSDQSKPAEAPKEEEKKEAKPAKKGKGKSKKKLEAERKAEEERQRLLKEEEDRKRAEEEERQRIEEEKRAKEEAERKAEEDRLREEAEARERELAEKIVVVSDDEEGKKEEEIKKERPEDKFYNYNGKEIKPILLKSDITDDIKEKAFEMGFSALASYTAEKEMSEYIKTEFDKLFEPEWQIVIGKDFSVAFSFEIENFIFFQIEDIYFLFYKL